MLRRVGRMGSSSGSSMGRARERAALVKVSVKPPSGE